MLYGLLVTVYTFICLLLVLLILVQKGKSSMGLGGLGAGTQILFGGSGGQDLFQKTTWVLGSLFMAGSLLLALMKSYQNQTFTHRQPSARPAVHHEAPISPTIPTAQS
jgi:preprotein translocase subunit SecG